MSHDKNAHRALYPQHLQRALKALDGAMEQAGADTIVIFSGALHYAFLDDHAYPFIANPHFAYCAPATNVPDSYIIYQSGKTPVLAFCQPSDYWHAAPAAPASWWSAHFDLRIIGAGSDAKAHLPETMKSAILIGDVREKSQALGIERINPNAALHWLDWQRAAKTEYEIARMRDASRLGAIAHSAAAQRFAQGDVSEYELHQCYLDSLSYIDADLPYPSIVGLNQNAAVLHYQHRERKRPEQLLSFLIDAGAACADYASDITRTYAASTGLFADLIEAMDVLQLEVCSRVKPGVDYRELHVQTHHLLADVLRESRIGLGSADELVASGVTRALLPHGLGHYLGLQVHDVAGHLASAKGVPTERPEADPFLRLTRSLSANEVLTIEPGLYFIEMLLEPLRRSPNKRLLDWLAIDALTPFGGIRIEDNVRVIADGHENLTREAFAAL